MQATKCFTLTKVHAAENNSSEKQLSCSRNTVEKTKRDHLQRWPQKCGSSFSGEHFEATVRWTFLQWAVVCRNEYECNCQNNSAQFISFCWSLYPAHHYLRLRWLFLNVDLLFVSTRGPNLGTCTPRGTFAYLKRYI